MLHLLGAVLASRAVHVPGGHVLEDVSCITRVDNRGTFDTSSFISNSSCHTGAFGSKSPSIQIYAADVHLQSEKPLTSFTADWVVPPLPKKHSGQVVYFWPGFKSVEPEMGYPVREHIRCLPPRLSRPFMALTHTFYWFAGATTGAPVWRGRVLRRQVGAPVLVCRCQGVTIISGTQTRRVAFPAPSRLLTPLLAPCSWTARAFPS
jgi:hypothetical protein